MPDIFSIAEQLQKEYATKLPPVHLWDPALSGDLDMRVARNGRWYYQGDEIQRHALAKLFSSILKREGDDYFLVTPVEKWKIEVEVAPFYIVSFEKVNQSTPNNASTTSLGAQLISFTTYTENKFIVDGDHPIWMQPDQSPENAEIVEQLLPLVTVRDNMPGLICREVYYQLIELALSQQGDSEGELFLWSAGKKFSLGSMES